MITTLLADFEGAEEAFRSLMGFNSADGKGNFVLSLEMTKTGELMRQCFLIEKTIFIEQHFWTQHMLDKVVFILTILFMD